MSEPLSDNQQRLMVALRRKGQLTTEQAGDVRDRRRRPLTADVARKILSRLEFRDLVSGDGRGGARAWSVTEAGLALLAEVAPASAGGFSRPYFVLEELTLGALVRKRLKSAELDENQIDEILQRLDLILDAQAVYVSVDKVVAVNGADAYRKVGKLHYRVSSPPTLVAVAERMFQPRKIKVNDDDPSVSIS